VGEIAVVYYKNKEKRVEKRCFKKIKDSFFNWKILVILGLFLFVFSPISQAAIRDTLTYQGKILDSSMLPPVDGNYNMQFTIYDSLVAGNLLWTETWNAGNQVAISDGVFTVELNNICASWIGACASNGGVSWSTDSLYLEIGYDADGNGSFEETFAPRKRFTAVPYAQMAARLETASSVLFTDNTDHSLAWNQAADRTLTVENTNGANVANLSVEGQVRVGQFAVAPAALGNGALYYNTANHNLYLYQNSAWQIVGGSGSSDDIWDADLDTGVQTEEGADEDKIRFDIGNTSGTAYPDILVLDGTNGFVWNDSGAAALDFRIEGDTNANLIFVDASADKVGFGNNAPGARVDITASDANALRINPYNTGAGNMGELQFMELVANGSNYVGFKSPDNITTSLAWVLPNADGAAGAFLKTDGAGNLGWATSLKSLWDADADTGIQVEEGADDDTIRFDLGTTASDALKLTQTAGFVWNDSGLDTLDVRMESDTDANLFFLDAGNNNIGIGEAAPDTNAKLEVAGNVMMDDYLYFQNTTTDYLRFDGSNFILSNDLLPSASGTYNLGSSTMRWDKTYIGGNSLHIGVDTNDYDISYDTANAALVFNEVSENTDWRVEGDTDINLFFVDAGNNNIGIGEAAPDVNAKLEVAGNVMMDDYLYFNNATIDYLRHDGTTFVMSDDFLASANNTYDFGTTTVRWQDQFMQGALNIGANGDDYDVSFDTTNNNLVFNEGGETNGLRIEGDTHANLLLVDGVNDRVGVGIDDLTLFDNRMVVENSTTDAVLRLLGPDGTYGYGARLRFGDGDYVYMDEYADDNFMMYAYGNIYLDSGAGGIYAPDVYTTATATPRRAMYVDSTGLLGYQPSSLRYKENVVNMEDIDWLYNLRPVNFDYKDHIETKYDKYGNEYTVTIPGTDVQEYGLIAEEVESVNALLVSYNEDGLVETVEYDKLVTPMLKAIQDQKGNMDPLLERIKVIDNGLEISRSGATDEVDSLVLYQDSNDSAGLHLVKTGTGALGQQAAIYVSGAKNSSAGDNDGIGSGYGLYVNSETTGTAKLLGLESDDTTGGKLADTEAFYVRADGVTKVYEGDVVPTFGADGEFGFYTSGGTRRLYFESNGTRTYINRSGTGDYSEYFRITDPTLKRDWGTVVIMDVSGSDLGVARSVLFKDKNVLGVVSEFGTRNNDDEEGMRHEDFNWANIAMLGQVPVKVTNQNGPIAVGDYLTSSSVIGHAMKADSGDPILGIAMEAFSGTVQSSEGMVDCLLSRNNQGNIATLLQDLQERQTLTAEDVLAVINNESLALNYLVMTKGEVMEGLKVHGELELDSQNIGSTVVLSGEQRVRVYFPESFRIKPIVTVSPELTADNETYFDFQYLLYDVNADGFSIKLNQPLDYDLRFNWQAFAQADYSNDFEIDIPDSTPVSNIQPLVSFDCRADNLSACVTARDCWQFADIAKWTGSSCVLK